MSYRYFTPWIKLRLAFKQGQDYEWRETSTALFFSPFKTGLASSNFPEIEFFCKTFFFGLLSKVLMLYQCRRQTSWSRQAQLQRERALLVKLPKFFLSRIVFMFAKILQNLKVLSQQARVTLRSMGTEPIAAGGQRDLGAEPTKLGDFMIFFK